MTKGDLDFRGLDEFFVDEIGLYRSSKNIQVILLRQTHDYSIFRTEETRELNTVTLPNHTRDNSSVVRVAMLASKQKAPENRHHISLLRTLAEDGRLDEQQKKCTLKDNLCQRCPRCVLFGSVSVEVGGGKRYNIKHRISYSTAYSIEPYDEISETMTFNAVDSVSQSTGQALGYTENISPLANFPSIVTLNATTEKEFLAYLKTVLSCKSYGAETRIKGDITNHVIGLVGGLEEILTPLDLLLSASVDRDEFLSEPVSQTYEILQEFAKYGMFKDRLLILRPKQLTEFMGEISNFEVGSEFVSALYKEAETFSEKLANYG